MSTSESPIFLTRAILSNLNRYNQTRKQENLIFF
ncbi:uncharacterized protein METZ01_LOCUS47919 [marine metagenome]|uniref:Uncharacterized protein n=1 Tax=marine metagenome TaxID=408172 RepID=A0A381RT47_9ZZZZ